jgi:hypothetical protein
MVPVLAEWLAKRVFQFIAVFSRPLDALRESPHTRSATDDARIHLDGWIKQTPVLFAVVGTAVAAFAAVFVPTDLGVWSGILAAVAGAAAVAAVPTGAFVYFWITAPARQRDEARAALKKKPRAKVRRVPPSTPLTAPNRSYLTGHQIRKALDQERAKRLREQIQDELVAIIDQGRALSPNAFDEAEFGPFKLWNEKTDRFLDTVLGPLEAQRFRERYEPAPVVLSETIEHRLRRLADLRDRPSDWTPRVDTGGLRNACEVRRHVSQADLVVLAGDRGGAAQVPSRLDRAVLSAEIRDLADGVDDAIASRAEDEEREIGATERRARETSLGGPPGAVHDLAKSYAVRATRDAVLGEFGSALDRLVDAAIELGSVPRVERERYVQPEDDAFRSLPDALRRVADRVESFKSPENS